MGFVFTHKSFLYLNISVSLCGLLLPKSKPTSWTESKPDLRKLLPLCWNTVHCWKHFEWKKKRRDTACRRLFVWEEWMLRMETKSLESTFTGMVQPFCCSLVCISKQLLSKWLYGCWTSTHCSVLPQKWVFCDGDGLVLLKSLTLGRRHRDSVYLCIHTRFSELLEGAASKALSDIFHLDQLLIHVCEAPSTNASLCTL